jgi:excisionase family DNA binding protein
MRRATGLQNRFDNTSRAGVNPSFEDFHALRQLGDLGLKVRVVRAGGRGPLWRPGAYECAFAPPAHDESFGLEHPERALDRPERHAVLLDQLGVIRQLVAGSRHAGLQLCAKDGCHLLVCRLRIVGIKPVHAAQRTSYELAHPAVASLPSLSISSTLDLIAGVSVLYAHKNAPAGAGTPTGACTEPLGGTMHVNGTRLYRVKAVAEMFDVSVSTIYRAIEAGQLQALRIGSGKGAVRVPEAALGSFEAACVDAAHKAVLAAGEPGGAGEVV